MFPRVPTVLRCGYVVVSPILVYDPLYCEALHHHIVPRSEGSGFGCFWASAAFKQHRRIINICRPLGSRPSHPPSVVVLTSL